ncbi:MAG: trehalose-phosphatase [Microthrixaceae bacterium]
MDDHLRALVRTLRSDAEDTAIFVDFDGTLAPIVDDPAAAVPLPGIVEALTALTASYGLVAVISGRPVDYLSAHLAPGPLLVGLYGLERAHGGVVQRDEEAETWRPVLDAAARAAAAELPDGVGVEHKGLSLTLHVRTHPSLADTVQEWSSALAARTGLDVRRARRSAELHPPIATDKGTVLDELTAGRRVACYIGDDVGDLPAFDALDRLEQSGGTGVRVVVRSDETDPALLARADAVVDGPAEVLEVLRALAP